METETIPVIEFLRSLKHLRVDYLLLLREEKLVVMILEM
jgi:hypothetical protein